MATPLSSTIQRDGSGEQHSGAAAQPPKRCGGEIRRRDLFHRSTASENRRDFAHSEFLRDRLKKNSKQCSSMAKLKRKRLAPPFQPTPLDNSTGTDVCSPISSFAIWFRCTSSGPSASRRARACA